MNEAHYIVACFLALVVGLLPAVPVIVAAPLAPRSTRVAAWIWAALWSGPVLFKFWLYVVL